MFFLDVDKIYPYKIPELKPGGSWAWWQFSCYQRSKFYVHELCMLIVQLFEQSQTKQQSDAIPNNTNITELSRHVNSLQWIDWPIPRHIFYLDLTFLLKLNELTQCNFQYFTFGKPPSIEWHLKLFTAVFVT